MGAGVGGAGPSGFYAEQQHSATPPAAAICWPEPRALGTSPRSSLPPLPTRAVGVPLGVHHQQQGARLGEGGGRLRCQGREAAPPRVNRSKPPVRPDTCGPAKRAGRPCGRRSAAPRRSSTRVADTGAAQQNRRALPALEAPLGAPGPTLMASSYRGLNSSDRPAMQCRAGKEEQRPNFGSMEPLLTVLG